MYKIYLLRDINDLEYIGKTKSSLKERLRCHRKDRDRGIYCSSSKLNLHNCQMILLEECDENIASEREQYWMEQYPNRVNEVNAIHNKEEYDKQYYIDNKEHKKQYCIDNKQYKKEYDKQYRINNKEKKKEYYINNKEKAKEYYKNKYIDKVVKQCMNDIIDQVILNS